MRIRHFNPAAVLLAASILASSGASGQVLAPAEIQDPSLRSLQQTHLAELHAIAQAVQRHQFPYRFYLSRTLDLPENRQAAADQRSIQFDNFRGQVVLKITGNYFAAYSADRMSREERAAQTFNDVMLPLLEAAAPAFAHSDTPDAFAFEISHHVIRSILGVETESMENVVLILPRKSALKLVAASDAAGRAAAVSEGAAYLNAQPVLFWPGEPAPADGPRPTRVTYPAPAPVTNADPAPARSAPVAQPAPVDAAARTAKATGRNLDAEYKDTLAKMAGLDARAHFVPYAPPSFITFRGGQYLQIPITTTLGAADSGSQYKLAALAFDRHVAHLIRPVLACFKDSTDFTGMDFSSTVHLQGVSAEGDAGTTVEFIFPLPALRRYEQYELTGQQLLDASIVLINGERAGLELQSAEAGGSLK